MGWKVEKGVETENERGQGRRKRERERVGPGEIVDSVGKSVYSVNWRT